MASSSILFIVPYHWLDSVLWLRYTIAQLKKHGDVVLVTDYGVGKIRTFDPEVPQIEPVGMGVGRARNAGIMYGLQHGYDCLIFSDSHMLLQDYAEKQIRYLQVDQSIIPDNIEKLCNYKLAQPAITAVDVKSGKLVEGAAVLGDFLDEWTWQWHYILKTTTRKSITSTQPMFSMQRDTAEAIVSANGGIYTQCLYWGKENFDPTISAARLGIDMDLVPEVKVGHVYKIGSPKGWKKRFSLQKTFWLKDIDRYEPWYGKYQPESPYLFGIQFSDAVYALKHYGTLAGDPSDDVIYRLPVDRTALSIASQVDWIMKSIREFNKNAKYTRHQVYERLATYLVGAFEVPVR